MEIYSRITGYYRAVSFWNKGKKEEFKARKTYVIPEFMQSCQEAPSSCEKPSTCSSSENCKQVSGVPQLFFYSDTCIKCKPLKQFLKEQGVDGQWVNVSNDDGLALAKKYSIRNLPTLIIQRADATEAICDTEAIKKCVSMAS